MSPDSLLVPQPTREEFPEFVSIPLRVARNAEAWPDKRAVVCDGKSRTWAAFDRRVNQIARALAGMGVGKGDKIGRASCREGLESVEADGDAMSIGKRDYRDTLR